MKAHFETALKVGRPVARTAGAPEGPRAPPPRGPRRRTPAGRGGREPASRINPAIADFRARRAADQQARINALLLDTILSLAGLGEQRH